MLPRTLSVFAHYLLRPDAGGTNVFSMLLTSRTSTASLPTPSSLSGPKWQAWPTLAKPIQQNLRGHLRPSTRPHVAWAQLKLPKLQTKLVNLDSTHRLTSGPFTDPAPLELVFLQIRKPEN